jgi:hypothetical protein
MPWREHAIALLAALDFSALTGDSLAGHVATEGLRAAKHWTPRFDTGSWTRPCLTAGPGDRGTHLLFIALANALYERTSDDFWRATAQRWADYVSASVSTAQ